MSRDDAKRQKRREYIRRWRLRRKYNPRPATPQQNMTARRVAIIEFIREYMDVHSWSPSLQEIMDGCNIRSKSNAKENLIVLAEYGKLILGGGHRMIRVLPEVAANE